MTEAILDIRYWGNSLGIRLPVSIAQKAHVHADQRVRLSVEDSKIIISPIQDEPLTLKARLERFNPKRHGGEVMDAGMLGAEKW